MTREEVTRILHIMFASYPNFNADNAKLNEMIETWMFLLNDYKYNDIALGLKAYIVNDTTGFAPTVEPIKGEWIEHKWAEEVDYMLISNYECSECHCWKRETSNFCPDCGADMRGGKKC